MSTTYYIGHSQYGRMFVDMKLDRTLGTMPGTDHKPVRAGAPTLSIVGLFVANKRRSVTKVGLLLEEMRAVHTPADGWTASDLGTLLRIWRNFHLNYLQAGCVHMRPRRAKADERQTCRVTGYRYGAAWLYEPIPAATLADFKRLQALPTGDIPAYVQ